VSESQTLSHGGVAQLLECFRELRIVVVGDVMLDEYFLGTVERASPEAPVPVVKVSGESCGLGGAANVASVAAALGSRVELWGIVGEDSAGKRFLVECEDAGIDARNVVEVADRPTTRKLRILAQHQQVVRLDWEDSRPVDESVGTALVERLRSSQPADAIVISDYSKGLLSPTVLEGVIAVGRQWGVPILVDPKSVDFSRYKGATLIKPNLHELEAVIGRKLSEDLEADLAEVSTSLLEAAEVDALVVTLGEKGMGVFSRQAKPLFVPTSVRDVYDVSGAGDTVIAALALSLAAGAALGDAVQVANEAAGIAVGKSGVAVVEPRELAARFAPGGADKILSREELIQRVAWWRMQDQRIVLTNGCFDLLHVGHVHLLREAAQQGDVLIVAINSDDSVRRLKGGNRPLISADERAALLAALKYVDSVVVFDEDTPRELLVEVRPDVLAKGADYREDQVVGRRLIADWGGSVVLIPLVPDRSTSGLLERIRSTDAS
jgi:D-beta-D-heptose 7-phosphate kinase/D-beta-D-heptose 1-phosphate adenosyltransferase